MSDAAAATTPTVTETTATPAAPEVTSMITETPKAPDATGADGKTIEAKGDKTETKVDTKTDDKPYAIAVPKEFEPFVDKAALEGFAKLAKEAGVTLEQAEKIAKFDFERRAAEVKKQDADVVSQSDKWLADIKKDPEMGGDKLAVTQANVNRAFSKFGDDATAKELMMLGMQNHPALVRLLSKVGAVLGEDSGTIKGAGTNAGKAELTREEQLNQFYPTVS